MKATIPEKAIENQILHYLKIKGIFAFKNQSVGVFDPTKKVFRKAISQYQIKGASDILGILSGGQFLAIEVKSSIGELTKEQHLFIGNIIINGGVAFTARSIEEVDAILSINSRERAHIACLESLSKQKIKSEGRKQNGKSKKDRKEENIKKSIS